MRSTPCLLLCVLLATLCGAVSSVLAEQDPRSSAAALEGAAAETLDGRTVVGLDIAGLSGERLTLSMAGDETRAVPLTELVAVRFRDRAPRERALGPEEVAVDLWTGEVLRGRIRGGDESFLELRSSALGDVKISIEWIAGLRFLERLERAEDAPDLTQRADEDQLFLTGGDRLTCTLVSFGADGLVCDTVTRDGAEVGYDQITAIRLVEDLPPKLEGVLLDFVLRDGSRVIAEEASIKEGVATMRSASGFDTAARLPSVVAIQMRSDAFRYLTDLPRPKVEIEPFWEPVAGTADALYRPRFDRSFANTQLQSGGRSWLRGIGVHSGTTLTYALDGEFREFRTHVGLDDAAGGLGGVVFVVEVDGEERWNSGFVHAGRGDSHGRAGPVDAGRIDVSGGRTLTLRVLAGDEQDPYPIQDQADWLGSMLLR